MTGRFTAACIQFTASREPAVNRAALDHLIRRAKAEGADFIMTPEVSDMMEPRRKLGFAKAQDEGAHQTLAAMQALAAELETWLLLGSLVVRLSAERLANRSFLIDPSGAIQARYDKIHMFDVAVGDGQKYRESTAYRPGEEAVLAALPWGRLGMTICYDLRFPRLYRDLAQAGADFLSVPSAFTRVTGAAHWHALLRARAIECGAYVFAPAQCGDHDGGRQTYGHSLIVAPWGEVLADQGEAPGVLLAEIDPAEVARVRGLVPALRHDRRFSEPTTGAPTLAEAGE